MYAYSLHSLRLVSMVPTNHLEQVFLLPYPTSLSFYSSLISLQYIMYVFVNSFPL